MSRARNRADGDFGDLDITNIGAVSLDSIKGDADGNTSLAFSGSDVITITTGGTTAATFSAAQLLTITDDLVIKSGGTIGGANDTDLLTLGNAALTVAGTLAATTGTFSGILKTDDATEATSTTDGSLQTDGGLSVVKDAVFGDDVKLLSDSAVLSFGADGDVTLTHAADTSLTLNVMMAATTFEPSGDTAAGDNAAIGFTSAEGLILTGQGSTSDITIKNDADTTVLSIATGTTAVTFAGDILIPDAGGIGSASVTNAMNIGADGDITLTQDLELQHDGAILSFGSNDEVSLTHVHNTGLLLNSANVIQFRDSALNIGSSADGQLDIAADTEVEITTALVEISADATVGDDLTLKSDAAVLGFGADTDVTLTHVADTGLLLNGTSQLQFNDASQNITAPSATVLDINATDEIELNATLVDVNANLDVSGTYTGAGLMTTGGNIVIPNDGNIGSVGDTDSIAISSAGVTTFSQKDVHSIGISVKNGATSAGFVEFFEDSDNGSNKVTLIGPASTADVTVVLPSAAGTVATTDDATALAIALG